MKKPLRVEITPVAASGSNFHHISRSNEYVLAVVAGVSAEAVIDTAGGLLYTAKDLVELIVNNPEGSAALSAAASFLIDASIALHGSIGVRP